MNSATNSANNSASRGNEDKIKPISDSNKLNCEQCNEYGHDMTTCPKPLDSPETNKRKYKLYTEGGWYQGIYHYGGDYQGGADYLQAQLNIKFNRMTAEEYEEYMDEFDRW